MSVPHPLFGKPLTADDMPWEYYRVPMSWLGEDCERIVALGHVTPARMVAASNKLNREAGPGSMSDVFATAAEAAAAVSHRWAVRSVACTWDGEGECPQRGVSGCLEAWMIEEFSWMIDYLPSAVNEGTPGAFPITILDL